MLLETLAASILGNALVGKGVIRAAEGVISIINIYTTQAYDSVISNCIEFTDFVLKSKILLK